MKPVLKLTRAACSPACRNWQVGLGLCTLSCLEACRPSAIRFLPVAGFILEEQVMSYSVGPQVGLEYR